MSQSQTVSRPRSTPHSAQDAALRLALQVLTAGFAPQGIRVRTRLVEGWLQIACESEQGPEVATILPWVAALLRTLRPSGVAHVAVCGQRTGETRPLWGRGFRLAQTAQSAPAPTSSLGQLLQAALASLGVVVSVQPQGPDLHINCLSLGSIDKLRLAELIVQTLRSSQQTLRSARVVHQIAGQSAPEWILTLDLRSPALMAQALARWGDLRALTWLVNWALKPFSLRASLTLRDHTLHLDCHAGGSPEGLVSQRARVLAQLSSLLTRLDPQGIHRVVLQAWQPQGPQPIWVARLTLPTTSPLATELAQQGELAALSVLLSQLLNPQLAAQLSVRSTRVKLRLVAPLLHVVCESVGGPPPQTVTRQVADWVEALQISGVTGVRLYGRAAGQAQPDWAWGRDFLQAYFSTGELETVAAVAKPAADHPTSEPSAPEAVLEDWLRSGREPSLGVLDWSDLAELGTDLKTRLRRLGRAQLDHWGAQLLALRQRRADQPTQPARPVQLAALTLGLGLLTVLGLDYGLRQTLGPSLIAAPEQFSRELATSEPLPPALSLNNPQLDAKLALFRHHLALGKPAPEVLIVGSSRALRGIDPAALAQDLAHQGYSGVAVFNFGVNGATAKVVDLLMTRLLPPEQLPKLIIWADGARAFNSGRHDLTYQAIAQTEAYSQLLSRPPALAQPSAKPSPDQPQPPALDLRHQAKAKLIQVYSQFTSRLIPPTSSEQSPALASPSLQDLNEHGFLPWAGRFDRSTYFRTHAQVSGRHDGDYQNFNLNGEQMQALQSMATFCRERDLPLVVVNMPLNAAYLDATRSAYEQVFRSTLTQIARREGFLFRDLSLMWPGRDDYFSDPSHLNQQGAKAVAATLAADPLISWPVSNHRQAQAR